MDFEHRPGFCLAVLLVALTSPLSGRFVAPAQLSGRYHEEKAT
jgi:hypothetical protein